MTLILENLYLGSVQIAKDIKFIKEKKIKYILICAKGIQQYYKNVVKYMQINITDNPCTIILSHFPDAIQYIIENIKNGPILIHCLGGKSRSVSFTIAYIMFLYGYNFNQAFIFVKQKHFEAQPNPGFIKQLEAFEKVLQIYGKPKQHNFNIMKEIIVENKLIEQIQNKILTLQYFKNKNNNKNNQQDEDNEEDNNNNEIENNKQQLQMF